MMTQAKLNERIKNLSVTAQKVYSAVPIAEAWSMTRIHAEMQRIGGTTRDQRIVHGCLNSLKESGLIEEPERSVFVRAAVKPDKPTPTHINPVTDNKDQPMPAPTAKQPRQPLAILSELASRCKALADAIETAALEIDEYVAAKDVDAGKLKQLQALLKGLA